MKAVLSRQNRFKIFIDAALERGKEIDLAGADRESSGEAA